MWEGGAHIYGTLKVPNNFPVEWNVKNEAFNISNFITYVISIITREHLIFTYDWKYGFHK